MLVPDLVKWKRALNEINFKHEELKLVKELSSTSATDFMLFLEEYCKSKNIDINSLKQKKADESANKTSEQKQLNQEEEVRVQPYKDLGKQVVVQPEVQDDLEKKQMKDVFTKLFKKLALNLHPDKVQGLSEYERAERIELFKKAKKALDDEDYFILLEMSDRFNIRNPNNYKQQTKWMNKKIKTLNKEIEGEKTTYNFLFGNCETDKEKANLIKRFLLQLFNIRS